MKTYQTEQIRNIALIGNSGSGKTTLAEAMAFEGGVIDRKGAVESKNTISDYSLIEQQNESSLFSTLLYTEYQDKKINILDTPGLDDFIGGVVSSLIPSDLCVMIINSQNGVEVGTEITSRYVEKLEKPMMIVLNHLDHDKANYEKTIESVTQSFGAKAIALQYPLSTGQGFDSIIDLVKMKMLKYSTGQGEPEVLDIPANERTKAEELHASLIEKAAEADERLMEIFFEKDTLTEDEMKQGIAKGIATHDMYPIICTSAKNSIGISRMLEFISNLAPAPNEVKGLNTKDGKEIKVNPSGPASLFVFKTSVESHIGEINYFKVMSGELTEGIDKNIHNIRTIEIQRQLDKSAGKNPTKVPNLAAG